MSLSSKLIRPRDILIEKTAGELAATWFEAALNTPEINTLRKKYRNDPKRYARMNFEKFIPAAVNILIGMLGRQDLPLEMREEIYNAIIDRANDPENVISDDIIKNGGVLPNIDVKKLLDENNKPVDKIGQLLNRDIHKDLPPTILENPPKATRH